MDIVEITKEHQRRAPLYKALKDEVIYTLQSVIERSGIKVHDISGRVKTIDSFLDKIKGKESKQPFDDIQDLCGVRVICLFLSDLSRVADIIRAEFEVIAESNKIEDADLSSFGYMSVHFIVKLKEELKGPRYNEIKDLLCEIQTRTIAMHSWATVSHYLDYKSQADVPEALRKDFFALSGLFYVADSHFEMFFKQVGESRSKMERLAAKIESFHNTEINLDSLSAYLKIMLPDREHCNLKTVSGLVQDLLASGYKYIGEVDSVCEKTKEAFLRFEEDQRAEEAALLVEEGREFKEEELIKFWDIALVRISFEIYDRNFEGFGRKQDPRQFAKYRKTVKK